MDFYHDYVTYSNFTINDFILQTFYNIRQTDYYSFVSYILHYKHSQKITNNNDVTACYILSRQLN
jgi:hypothetical protein